MRLTDYFRFAAWTDNDHATHTTSDVRPDRNGRSRGLCDSGTDRMSPKPGTWTIPEHRDDWRETLDVGIRDAVRLLNEYGIRTCQSCQGGWGHGYPVPTIEFFGSKADAKRALAVALESELPVTQLRRVTAITGPWCRRERFWSLTFSPEPEPETDPGPWYADHRDVAFRYDEEDRLHLNRGELTYAMRMSGADR